uniref:Uncharacterized protein n=1 Tax=Lepisosteus oculatus TaxID=7918 RepID=W5MZD7_LEPOC
MKVAGGKGDARCDEDMEEKAGSQRQDYCCRTFANALSFTFSLVSVAFCIFLGIQTSVIKERVFALETGSGQLLYHQVPGFSVDQLNSMIQERVDELLAQRSYEHLAKIRTARQAPPDCNCPAGPPGKRGRRGRNGEPGPPVSTSDFTKGTTLLCLKVFSCVYDVLLMR